MSGVNSVKECNIRRAFFLIQDVLFFQVVTTEIAFNNVYVFFILEWELIPTNIVVKFAFNELSSEQRVSTWMGPKTGRVGSSENSAPCHFPLSKTVLRNLALCSTVCYVHEMDDVKEYESNVCLSFRMFHFRSRLTDFHGVGYWVSALKLALVI